MSRNCRYSIQVIDYSRHHGAPYKWRNVDVWRFRYYCAQSEDHDHESKKHPNLDKHRDKIIMDKFPCEGALFITIYGKSEARITYRHKTDHMPYCNIDIPPDVAEYVCSNTDKNVSQVSDL
jgi:hypothetical protein